VNLNSEEKALVLELARNPVFTGMLRRMSDEFQVPKYKRGGDETAKYHEWIHRSGFVDGRDFVLKLMRYENDN
jgi:hypothetical protein